MIHDKLGEFGDAHTIPTSATGTYRLPNQIDLQVARDIGSGQPVYLVIGVDTGIGSTGSATALFKLVSDDTATFSTTGGASEHVVTSAIAKTVLATGYQMVFPLPMEGVNYERYLGLMVTIATAKLNAGKINAYLTQTPPKIEYYDDAIAQATT